MSRQRTWSDDDLINAVKQSTSMRQCLQLLGLVAAGGNYDNIDYQIRIRNLDTSHWTGQGWRSGSTEPVVPAKPLAEILVKNSNYRGGTDKLKNRLLKEGLLFYECGECGISEWNSKPLTLQLDHKNGDRRDNRAENLRLLCPNCDSQLDTHRGRNKQRKREAREEALLKSLGLVE